jgi:MYXO-CTERM domain-containing protein
VGARAWRWLALVAMGLSFLLMVWETAAEHPTPLLLGLLLLAIALLALHGRRR